MNLHLLKNLNASGAMTAVSRRVQNHSMKTTLALIIAAASLCGCNTTSLTVTKPDGVVVSVKNTRLFWATDSYAASWTTNGASLSANRSNVDREALGTIVSAAVSAATKP
jgi:hypothetical protein